jgi:hypothetical protein
MRQSCIVERPLGIEQQGNPGIAGIEGRLQGDQGKVGFSIHAGSQRQVIIM